MTDRSVAMLGTVGHPSNDDSSAFGHPAHRGFADAIDADPVIIESSLVQSLLDAPVLGKVLRATFLGDVLRCVDYPIPEYDVYVTENARILYAAPLIKSLYPDSTIVCLGTDIYLYGLNAYVFDKGPLTNLTKNVDRSLETGVLRAIAGRYVDGVIAASTFVGDFLRPFLSGDAPIRVAHPFVQPDKYNALRGVEPDLSANAALFVGAPNADMKGVDMLVDAWPSVREQVPDATLSIVGPNHPEKYGEVPGVEVTGYVESERFPDLFGSKSLYVHPARVDPFPVSTLEAMCAGLPTLVTETTGTRSVVWDLDERMVVTPSAEALASGVVDYFRRSPEETAALSDRIRDEGLRFDAETRKAAFARTFRDLMGEI